MAERELPRGVEAQVATHMAQVLLEGRTLGAYLRSSPAGQPWASVLDTITLEVLEGFVTAYHASGADKSGTCKAWLTHWCYEWKLVHPCG